MTKKTPQKVAVISDIHSNLEALMAVLEDIEKEKVDKTICCGDIIGYGANPNECIDEIRKRNIPVVMGNHDSAALKLTDISHFNEIARRAIIWTRDNTTPENLKWIEKLPYTINEPPFFIVHSSPKDPQDWNYILTMGDARLSFQYFEGQICFIGHSHQPFFIELHDKNLYCPTQKTIVIKDDYRYLINVGSVGQPRDRNANAAYVICDLKNKLIQLKRLPYDIPQAQQKIINAGIPRELAERIAFGW